MANKGEPASGKGSERKLDPYHVILASFAACMYFVVFVLILGSMASVAGGTWHIVDFFIHSWERVHDFEAVSAAMLTLVEFYLLAFFLFLAGYAFHYLLFGLMPHTERISFLLRGIGISKDSEISYPAIERALLTSAATILVVLAVKKIISECGELRPIELVSLALATTLAIAAYVWVATKIEGGGRPSKDIPANNPEDADKKS